MDHNHRAPLPLRLSIWLLAIFLGFLAVSSSGVAASGQTPNTGTEVALDAAPAVQLTSSQLAASGCNPSAPDPLPVGQKFTDASVNQACIKVLVDKVCPVEEGKSCDPDHFLPSSRWRDQLNEILAAAPGWGNFGDQAGAALNKGLGSLFMGIGGFIWGIIHELAAFISTMDTLSGAAGRRINEVFASFAGVLTSSGLIAILILITAVVMFRQVARIRAGGMPSGILSTIMTVVLPLGVLFSITTAAASTTTTNADGKTVQTDADPSKVFMSPVWLAHKGIWLAEMPASAIANGLGESSTAFGDDKLVNPSCYAYVTALKEAYKEAWTRKHPDQPEASSLTLVVNTLFDEAFMTFYNDGQFQNSFSGQRIVCHLLEGFSGISEAEQALVAAAARYPAGRASGEVISVYNGSTTPSYRDPRYFAPHTNFGGDMSVDDKRKYLLGWAACAYAGGSPASEEAWAMDPAWYWGSRIGDDGTDGTDPTKGAIGGYGCRRWWNETHKTDAGVDVLAGDAWQVLRFKGAKNSNIRSVQSDSTASTRYKQSLQGVCSNGDRSDPCVAGKFGVETLSGFSKTVLVTKGEIGGFVFASLMAMVAAFMYGYVLIGMFGGLLLAKVGFTVLLAASPGILFMLAIPSATGRKNSRGMRLLRMMIGWMVATALISALIMLFALFISLIRGFLDGDGGGFMYVISPAISLVLIHFLMKAAGMKSIASPLGSMGLAMGAAQAAASGNLKDMKKGGNQLGGLRKKGEDLAEKRLRKRDRKARIEEKARREGKDIKELREADGEWARRNRPDDLLERFSDYRAARRGKKEHVPAPAPPTDADAADDAAADGTAATSSPLAGAIDDLKDGAKEGDAERGARKDARAADATQDDLNDSIAGASDGQADVADDLNSVLADTDVLADTASSADEAAARSAVGAAFGQSAVDLGHLDPVASQDAQARAVAALVSDPHAYQDMMLQGQASTLGLVGAGGSPILAASGSPVLGFSGPSGLPVLPHTFEFQQVAAEVRAQSVAGSLGDAVTVGGVTYQLSSHAASIGQEGMTAAAAVAATELGIPSQNVIVSRTGTMVAVAPPSDLTVVPGTGMTHAATAVQQVEVSRNVTQWLHDDVREQLSRLSPAGQAAAVETIVMAYSQDGVPADALSILEIDATSIERAYGDDAAMASLAAKRIDLPPALLNGAIAEGKRAEVRVTLTPAHQAATMDLAYRGANSLEVSDELIKITEASFSTRGTSIEAGNHPEATAISAIEDLTKAVANLSVVRSSAVALSGAASGSPDPEAPKRVVVEHEYVINETKQRVEAIAGNLDPVARQVELNEVLSDVYQRVITLQRIAGVEHDRSVNSVMSVTDAAFAGPRRSAPAGTTTAWS